MEPGLGRTLKRIGSSCLEFTSFLPLANFYSSFKTQLEGASLVAQWLRIHLPVQGIRVRSLVREDPTCCGATKPVSHN